jgi:pectate lyase
MIEAIQDSHVTNPEIFTFIGEDQFIEPNRFTTTGKSNKTVQTSNGQLISRGELRFLSCNNLIIRNFKRKGPYLDRSIAERDFFSINACTHVWIDHCDFDGEGVYQTGSNNDYVDGCIDIGSINETESASDLITISNCRFWNVARGVLIGFNDSYIWEDGKNRVTLRNNWWKNVQQRCPMNRFGKPHLLEEFHQWEPEFVRFSGYPRPDGVSAIKINDKSQFYAQGCYFEQGDVLFSDEDDGSPQESGIITDNCFIGSWRSGTTTPLRTGNVSWDPNTFEGYTYANALKTPTEARDYALANAGANLIIEPVV